MFFKKKQEMKMPLPFRTGGIDASEIIGLVSKAKPKMYFVMNEDCRNEIRKLKSESGTFIHHNSIHGEFILGYDIIVDNDVDGLYFVVETNNGFFDWSKIDLPKG